MTYSVLVCDDDPELATEWVDKIQNVAGEDYQVSPAPSNNTVCEAVKEMLQRRVAARDKKKRRPSDCIFDNVDILIVDYDLLHIDENNVRLTGEGIARLARSFSNCAVVVIFNQFPEAQFDLSLRGHLSSHADLNIEVELLNNTGLWHNSPWDGFRPWYWQTLSKAVDTQKSLRENSNRRARSAYCRSPWHAISGRCAPIRHCLWLHCTRCE